MTPSKFSLSLVEAIRSFDPGGQIAGQTFRDTYDQLYDGGRTGRYSWNQLYKTEKTHFGTLIEINLRRSLDGFISDGRVLDFEILGREVDCKFSQKMFAWMIPNESVGHHAMVCHANDELGVWSLGFVETTQDILSHGANRDQKRHIRADSRSSVAWAWRDAPLIPNILLQLPAEVRNHILSSTSGQKRIDELLRNVLEVRIPRGTVETVAQQKDPMKRVRGNGGARTNLQPEGIIVLGGYKYHRLVAQLLGLPIPGDGDTVAARVTRAEDQPLHAPAPGTVLLDEKWWRVAGPDKAVATAPLVPFKASLCEIEILARLISLNGGTPAI